MVGIIWKEQLLKFNFLSVEPLSPKLKLLAMDNSGTPLIPNGVKLMRKTKQAKEPLANESQIFFFFL